MKHVILTVVLAMAMVYSAYAQEVPVVPVTEEKSVECNVVMIGAGQETIDLQLTAVDGMFTNVWFILTGEKQEEQMATAYMAVALEYTVSVTLEVPVGTATEPVVVTDLTPLKDIYMVIPQPEKEDKKMGTLPEGGKLILDKPFTK